VFCLSLPLRPCFAFLCCSVGCVLPFHCPFGFVLPFRCSFGFVLLSIAPSALFCVLLPLRLCFAFPVSFDVCSIFLVCPFSSALSHSDCPVVHPIKQDGFHFLCHLFHCPSLRTYDFQLNIIGIMEILDQGQLHPLVEHPDNKLSPARNEPVPQQNSFGTLGGCQLI
jgi:hypothetical protein